MNRATPLFIALDQGGHAGRALVVDATGAVHGHAERRIRTLYGDNDRIEHDPDEVVRALREVLREAYQQVRDHAGRIAAVGLATQRSSIVGFDRDTGHALTPVISWQDRRARSWLEAQQLDAQWVRRETGLRISAHYGASKMRWCLDHLPEVRAAQRRGALALGPLSSFLTWHLVGGRSWVTDPCNASRTLLWSLETRDWSPELLRQFAIHREWLPRCVPNRHAFGDIDLGDRRLPLQVVTGDQAAVPFAFGRAEANTVFINIGTGAFLQRVRPGPGSPPGPLLRSVVWHEDRHTVFVDEGTVNGAGSALEAECGGREPGGIFAALDHWLDEVKSPPLFLNGIAGLGSPWWMADFPSRFIGPGDFESRLVAIVESIVFLLQRNLEELARLDPDIDTVVVSGGLSAVDGLCRRLADLCDYKVLRSASTDATALGLGCQLARMPDGWRAPRLQRIKSGDNGPLRARYAQWCAAMEAAVKTANQP